MTRRPHRITLGHLMLVGLIFAATSCAWLFLGRTMHTRSFSKDHEHRNRVGQIWGGEHVQCPPRLWLAPQEGADDSGECARELSLQPVRTRVRVHLDLDQRRKGLLWYSTYRAELASTYTFVNPSACQRRAVLQVPLPATDSLYDGFSVKSAGALLPAHVESSRSNYGATAEAVLEPGETKAFTVAYNSRGLDRWSYMFGEGTSRAQDFQLAVTTNFSAIDFPDDTLAPVRKRATGGGWELVWEFDNILTSARLAVEMPHRVNPGPLAAEMSLFAPVSLGFFFLVLLLVAVLKRVRLHVVHYAMLAAAFFSFHLLLAYLVDHLPLWLSFAIAALTSVGLVTSYLRLAVGARFALLWAGGAQLLYLVVFSLAFFLEGYTGLTITIFAVLTLFLIMQLTGRIDWSALGTGRPTDGSAAPAGPDARRSGPPSERARPAEIGGHSFSRVG